MGTRETMHTKFMVFHTPQRKLAYPRLKINDNIIECVTEFNFLGLIINSNLNWNNHIDHISKKISRVLGIMYRLKEIYPFIILLMLYNSLIVPHFNYCILVWGSKMVEGHPIHLLQKRAIRLVTNADYIAHTEPICKSLQLLKVTDMFSLAIWKFYYKLMNNLLPTYFETMTPIVPTICEHYEIRHPKYHSPRIHHEFAEYMLKYQLIRMLNEDNGSITGKIFTHSFIGFKLYIKHIIIATYNESCNILDCQSCKRRNT